LKRQEHWFSDTACRIRKT